MAERRVVNGQRLGPQQLYVIGVPGSGLVKIGIAGRPMRRLEELRGGNDITLVPAEVDRSALALLHQQPGGRTLERSLHKRFASRRVFGEWFNLGPLAVPLIRSAIRDPNSPVSDDSAGWVPRRRSARVIDHRAATARLAAEYGVTLPDRQTRAPVARGPVPLCAPRVLVYRDLA